MPYDLISGDELISGDTLSLSGDDVESLLSGVELVGARRHGGSRRNNTMREAAAIKQANAGLIVRDQTPTKARRLVIGVNSTGTVAAGASATITGRPQSIAFKPQRVVVPATLAPDFTIDDIKVGNKSQLVQSGSLAAEAFVQTSFGVEMDMDTVQTSQDLVFAVTNISGAARTFRAVVFGRSADF